MEEPHFNMRISQTLQTFGYDFDVSHPMVKDATDVFAEEFMRYVVMDSEATEVLERLCPDYKLGIVSNFAIPECLNQLLGKFRLDRFFDVVVISGAVNVRKPSPRIFHIALRALDVKAVEAVFVGDTPSMDVKGAKNVGMHAILIDRESEVKYASETLIHRFTDDGIHIEPDNVIHRLGELPKVLEDC
jgi:HAD superfamily hydrolase (TIGR01549 family)